MGKKGSGIYDPRVRTPLKAIEIYFPLNELTQLIDQYRESAHSSPDEALAIQDFKSRYKVLLSDPTSV